MGRENRSPGFRRDCVLCEAEKKAG
ncbi:hypothetical protein E2C01_095889 [Portunus trituberculatus]|uniref:Uncharacterized protein n=1 Tax=Portunus trituberculatus TaxID=210409 RepID=A0A5B7K573_PORTR|nr:hypothetical protein [Portunus trituberculatus]